MATYISQFCFPPYAFRFDGLENWCGQSNSILTVMCRYTTSFYVAKNLAVLPFPLLLNVPTVKRDRASSWISFERNLRDAHAFCRIGYRFNLFMAQIFAGVNP